MLPLCYMLNVKKMLETCWLPGDHSNTELRVCWSFPLLARVSLRLQAGPAGGISWIRALCVPRGREGGSALSDTCSEEVTLKKGGGKHLPSLVITWTYSPKNLHSVLCPKGKHLKQSIFTGVFNPSQTRIQQAVNEEDNYAALHTKSKPEQVQRLERCHTCSVPWHRDWCFT